MKNIFRIVLGSFMIVSMFVNTGCVEELTDNGGDGKENTSNDDSNNGGSDNGGLSEQEISFEWISDVQEDSPIVLVSGGQITLEFKTDNVESVTVKDAPLGWETNIDAEKSILSVKASSEGQTSIVNLTLIAESTEGTEKTITIPFSYVYVSSFDDPRGAFVLNEGNMTTENGSLIYITPEGEIIDDVYKQINGTELGNVCQDMAFCDGKIYIISQNGEVNETGVEFVNDGMLVVLDAKTLKKEKSFTKEQLSELYWPTHIAALDAQHVFIRDNKDSEGAIWRLNTETGEISFVDGSEGAPQTPFAVINEKIYSFQNGIVSSKIWEIGKDNDIIKESKLPAYGLSCDMSNIYGIQPSDDGMLWVLTFAYGKRAISKVPFKDNITKDDINQHLVNNSTPASANASGKRFAVYGNTIYYSDDTTLYSLAFNEEDSEPKELIDLYTFDTNAIELYNGISINPATGMLYVNTIKGVGNFYKTNSIWGFSVEGNWDSPSYKFDNYSHFPAGIFFPPQN